MEIENPGTMQTIKIRYCPSKNLFNYFLHSTSTSMFENAIFFEQRFSGHNDKSFDRCLVLKGAGTNVSFLKNLKYGWFLVKQIDIISGEYLVLIILIIFLIRSLLFLSFILNSTSDNFISYRSLLYPRLIKAIKSSFFITSYLCFGWSTKRHL